MGQNIKRARRQRQNQVLEHFRSILPSMRTTTIAICTLLLLSSSAWARESSSDVEIVDGRRLEKVTADADVAALAQKATDGSLKDYSVKIEDDVTDLSPLSGITEIGSLSIEDTEKLTDLSAL